LVRFGYYVWLHVKYSFDLFRSNISLHWIKVELDATLPRKECFRIFTGFPVKFYRFFRWLRCDYRSSEILLDLAESADIRRVARGTLLRLLNPRRKKLSATVSGPEARKAGLRSRLLAEGTSQLCSTMPAAWAWTGREKSRL